MQINITDTFMIMISKILNHISLQCAIKTDRCSVKVPKVQLPQTNRIISYRIISLYDTGT